MQATFDQIDLKPPQPGRWSMPTVLAVAAHLLLIAALTWGVHWKQDAQPVSFDAELWSAVAQEAAPRQVAPPPPPPRTEPKVEPKPVPKPTPPKPEPKAEPKPPDTREADIATAQAKKKKEEAEDAKMRELEKKKEADKKKAEDAKVREEEKKKKVEEAKEAEKLKQKKADERKALDDKIKSLEDIKQKAEAQRADDAAAKEREDNIKRMLGQAGAKGSSTATGTAQKSSGPSAGYAGRVRARIKPNVLFTNDIAGNPTAEVEVTTAPDGTIISRRLVKRSGVAEWDNAALAAIDRTGTLPRDVDGRVPSPMIIELRPRD